MRNPQKDARRKNAQKEAIIETGFRLFVDRTIDAVSLEEVARESGVGVATLYRDFGTKTDLLIAISVAKWNAFQSGYLQNQNLDATGEQRLSFFLDSFLDLYRNHRDLLRFNQFLNIYFQRGFEVMQENTAYLEVIRRLEDRFRSLWKTGMRDHTLRGDVSWQEAFSTILHIMLAAATRYAVGLSYVPENGSDPETELWLLKDMLYREYTVPKNRQGVS